jgi:AcrR family transcriptional regulator
MSHKIENARENLLKNGRNALISGGYDNLNVKELAAQCGMATGTFYQYFHNKDDLVMQIVYESCEVIPENIRERLRERLGTAPKAGICLRPVPSLSEDLSEHENRRAAPVGRL